MSNILPGVCTKIDDPGYGTSLHELLNTKLYTDRIAEFLREQLSNKFVEMVVTKEVLNNVKSNIYDFAAHYGSEIKDLNFDFDTNTLTFKLQVLPCQAVLTYDFAVEPISNAPNVSVEKNLTRPDAPWMVTK